MKIQAQQLEYVADLARIKLDNNETELFSRHLNAILNYIDKLNQLDTTNVEPMSHVLNMGNVLRQDVLRDSLSQTESLKNAPASENGFFKTPKVI